MSEQQGLFVAIEGGDGSGKGTQATKLEQWATEKSCDVLRISFPQYTEPSAKFAGRYLDGQYGEANSVHPELASLAYAVDRFAASSLIRAHLLKPKSLVIADRYVASNLAHQGTKLRETQKRRAFYDDILELEYDTLQLPKPDINLLLLVPTALAQLNVDLKSERSYTSKKRDVHEADSNHLELAKLGYQELAQLYPNEFKAIDCMKSENEMRSIDDIHESIKNLVQSMIDDREKV